MCVQGHMHTQFISIRVLCMCSHVWAGNTSICCRYIYCFSSQTLFFKCVLAWEFLRLGWYSPFIMCLCVYLIVWLCRCMYVWLGSCSGADVCGWTVSGFVCVSMSARMLVSTVLFDFSAVYRVSECMLLCRISCTLSSDSTENTLKMYT